MSVLANLVVRIGGDIKEWEKSQKALTTSLNKIGGTVERGGKTMTALFTGPIVAAAGGLALIAKKTADAGDEIQKMALRTGFSTEALSEYRHAAELSGTSIESVEKGVKRMASTLLDAENGMASSKDALAALGLPIEDLKDLKPEEQFNLLSASLAGVEGDSKRAALAQDIFGRAGTEMLPMLAAGADGLAEMRQEARDLGLVFSQESADAAAQFNDDLTRLQGEFTGLTREIGAEIMPIIMEQLMPAIRDHVIPAIKGFSESVSGLIRWFGDLDPRWQKAIGLAVGIVAAIGPVMIIVGKLVLAVSTLIKTFGLLVSAGKLLMAGFSLLLSPIGLVVAAIAAAIAIGYLLWKNWDEVVAFISGLWEKFSAWFGELWEGISEAVTGVVKGISDGISGAFQGLIDGSLKAWEGFKTGFLWVFEMIGKGIKGYFNIWIGLFNAIITGVERMVGGIASAINRIPSFDIPDWVPGIGGGKFGLPKISAPSLPRIPLMDTGGIVRGPGVFQVGAGVTEAVTVMERGGSVSKVTIPVYIGGRVVEEMVVEGAVRAVRTGRLSPVILG